MTTSWHADGAMLAAYADGRIDDARASSVEAHLLACDACRDAVAVDAERERMDRMWAEVAEVVDAPRAGAIERGLRRLGVSEHVGRILAATPSLRLSWLIAEAVALGQAVALANLASGDVREDLAMWGFLVIAALLPVLGVAFAYGPGVDPTYEIGVSAPMPAARLLLIRATAVLVVSVAIAALGALALPGHGWEALAWLLPSLALALAALALSTAIRHRLAVGIVVGSWALVAVALQWASGDRFAAFRAGPQLASVVLIAASAWVMSRRRESFEEGAFR